MKRDTVAPSLHISYQRPIPGENRAKASLLLLIILLTWTLAAFIVLRESILNLKFGWHRDFLDWTINPLVRPDADRWLMPIVLLGRYASLLVAPATLSPDYGGTVIGWTVRFDDPHFWIGLVAIAAWVVWFGIALVRRQGVAIFALLGLALTYGIVSNFPILIGTIFGERLMYLPSVFFVILVALLLAKLPRAMFVAVLATVVMLFSVRSFTYAARWNDGLSFYQTSLRENPGSIRLQILLISEHLARGEPDIAAALARRATEQFPAYWEAWIARAHVAMERREFDEAYDYLMTAAHTPRAPIARVARWMDLLEERRATTGPSTSPSPPG